MLLLVASTLLEKPSWYTELESEVSKMATLGKSIKVLPTKIFQSPPGAFAGVKTTLRRFQSTITVASLPSQYPKEALPFTHSKDFSTQVQSDFQVLNQAVLSASALAHQPQPVARELGIMEAADSKHNYDKILLLINHGDAAVKKNDPLGIPVLTGKGVGQALSLSHTTTMWCNSDTGLSPELVVFSPLGCAIQTALHAFPYNAPDSVRGVSWVCRGDTISNDQVAESSSLITKSFPGMDLSLCDSQFHTDDFLEWLRGRQERVIVGKSFTCNFDLSHTLSLRFGESHSHSTFHSCIHTVSSTSSWLQSFCKSTLDCGSLEFKDGAEMHVVGLY